MDNKDYEELEELEDENSEDEEQFDYINDSDELEEIPSEEIYENNNNYDFHNQNLQNQIRKIKNENKGNQNTINKLRQRKANTMSKGVEAPKSTPSTSSTPKLENPLSNLAPSKGLGKEAASKVGKTAAQAGKAAGKAAGAAGKAAAQGIGSALTALAANPYFWIIVGVLLLVMLIPILWGAYDNSGESSGGSSGSGDVAYVEGYEDCQSITVTDSGTYSLEDYVAGVIAHEAYTDEGIEALKAQAVAARTYAINATNKCTTAIGNSQASQTFSETPDDNAVKAANETAGQVLTYEGEIFSTMYDSFCYDDDDCPDSTYNEADKTYTVTYTKKPNNETHVITLSQETQFDRIVPGGGHASGMSQLVSYQMASEGKKYDEILYFFYSDGVEISTISEPSTSSVTGPFNGSFNIRTLEDKPDWLNAPDNTYYNKTINGDNWFQCVWYAKARAHEILSTMTDADETKRQEAITALLSSNGHGSWWYNNAQDNGSMSIFASSDDYTKPRPGAMISWKWNSAGCKSYHKRDCTSEAENYGHVAIIESVDEENKKVRVSDGWKKCGTWNNDSCFGYNSKEVNYDYLQSFGGNYIFLGYVYLTDYVGGS